MADSLDRMSSIPLSQKVLLLIIVLAGIGAAWYFLMYEEVQANIKTETRKVKTLQDELAKEQDTKRNLDRYKKEIVELRREREDMRRSLPESAEIADLLQQIHSEAKTSGLEISRWESDTTTRESLYVRIPVNIKLTGTFQQISTFYYSLARLQRIVNIEDIELVSLRKATDTQEERLVANSVATTFQYLPPAQAAPTTAKKGKKPKKGKK
ncbi:MAG: type IV pilus assembly protein PilO [Bradymonadia bacterium]|jgi:type IV pilus assembly protein PilO